MQKGDKIPMRVNGGQWLEATILAVTKSGRPGMVVVDEGIPYPFTLLGDKQAIAVTWNGDEAGDLFVQGRKVEFNFWAAAGRKDLEENT